MHTVWFKKSYDMPFQLKQIVFSEYTIFSFKEQNKKENEWTDNDDQTVEKILRNFWYSRCKKYTHWKVKLVTEMIITKFTDTKMTGGHTTPRL